MITIQGKGVSKGMAKGPLYFWKRPDVSLEKRIVSDIAGEKARLAAAQETAIAQLNDLAEKCRKDAGKMPVRIWQSCLRPTPCLWRTRILFSA